MAFFVDAFVLIRSFLERGGTILLVILLVIVAMWVLILDRWLYLRHDFKWDIASILQRWSVFSTPKGEALEQRRYAALSMAARHLNAKLPTLRTLAMICPLLGLLGTVVGMMLIFDTMSIVGTASARPLAGGISMALVTTMAGMVGALSGLFPAAVLGRRARKHLTRLQSGRLGGFDATTPMALPVGRRLLRLTLPPVGAVAITLGLALAMENAIVMSQSGTGGVLKHFAVNFIRVSSSSEVRRRERMPERPDPPEELPDLEQLSLDDSEFSTDNVIAVGAPRAGLGAHSLVGDGIAGSFSGYQDGDLLPLVKVTPIYPQQAAMRHLEGWVMVRFTVTVTGSVKDVEVVESSHEIFEKAAVEAAKKFKYRPRVVNGQGIEVRGVMNRISFLLDR